MYICNVGSINIDTDTDACTISEKIAKTWTAISLQDRRKLMKQWKECQMNEFLINGLYLS